MVADADLKTCVQQYLHKSFTYVVSLPLGIMGQWKSFSPLASSFMILQDVQHSLG